MGKNERDMGILGMKDLFKRFFERRRFDKLSILEKSCYTDDSLTKELVSEMEKIRKESGR